MALKLANNAVSALASAIDGSSLTLALTPGDGAKFPALAAGDWFPVTVVKSTGALEIMRCTARATDTLTVLRAQEGTAAQSFNAGDRVELRLSRDAAKALGAQGGRYGKVVDVGSSLALDASLSGKIIYAYGSNTVITLPDLTTLENGETITVQFTQNSGSVTVATTNNQNIISGYGVTGTSLAIPQGSVVKFVAGDAPYWFATISIAPPKTSANGYGSRTVSTAAPSGGNDGDIWYQV